MCPLRLCEAEGENLGEKFLGQGINRRGHAWRLALHIIVSLISIENCGYPSNVPELGRGPERVWVQRPRFKFQGSREVSVAPKAGGTKLRDSVL